MKKTITLLFALSIVIKVSEAQTNYLDSYIGNIVTPTVIATSSNQLNQPQDLDFKPGTNELWICQYGNSNGGTMNIFYNAGTPTQSNQLRKDSHAAHFFYYPSAIAFSQNGELGNTNEIQNTSSPTSTFMGPALWNTDTAIFARVFQNNWLNGFPLGSHIDMLHQSPFSMGIASDTAKSYWVMDGHNGNICKYDFVSDHGPGYDNHSAGKIWRYTDVTVTRVPQIPSHMVLDKANGWLYFIDGGSKKVKRMNTSNGTISGTLTVPSTSNEPLAGYWKVLGSTVETLDSLSTQPCGMDYYKDRLVVSDYTTGDIYIYNTAGTFSILDTIVTGHPGMMGIKVGYDGRIWCVNKTENKLYRLDSAIPALDASFVKITSPLVNNYTSKFYSIDFNFCDGNITPAVDIKNTGSNSISTMEIHYAIDGGPHTVYNWSGTLASGNTASITLPQGSIFYGSHQLDVLIMMVNGVADAIETNNRMMGSFLVIAPVQGVPFSENFSATTFPPTNWNYVNFNPNNKMSRASVSGFGIGSGAIKMDHFSGAVDITGQKDYLIMPLLDFSPVTSNAYLHFNVAHAQYTVATVDELDILSSFDCGETWTEIYNKSGAALATAPIASVAFTPSPSLWRHDSVNVSSFAGHSEVMIMFRSVSNFGNNTYIDDVNVILDATSLNEQINNVPFNLFPNPAQNEVNIEIASNGNLLLVTDLLGKEILRQNLTGQKKFTLDTSTWKNGLYFITLSSRKSVSTQKLTVQH